ncbi:hypothetical protein Tco_0914122 [Tanacetum coccineum]
MLLQLTNNLNFPTRLRVGSSCSVFKKGDTLLLLRVLQGPTHQEHVEAILGNKGLLFVTTAKGKDTCLNSALNLRGNKMIHGLRIKCCWYKLKKVVKFYKRRELEFLADPGISRWSKPHRMSLSHNCFLSSDDLDAFMIVVMKLNTAKVALMANLSHYGPNACLSSSEQSNVVNHSETEITSDSNIIPYSQYVIESQQAAVQSSNSSAQQDALILSVIEQLKTQVVNFTKINLDNKSVNDTLTAELKRYKEQVKVLKEGQNVDLRSNDNVSDSSAQSVDIDRLKQTLFEHLKEKESLMQTVTLFKNDFKKEESRNIDREIALEKKIKQLDNIVFKRDQSAQTKAQQLEPKLYDGNVIKNTSAIVIPDSKETLMLAEESCSKMLLKQQDPMMLEKKVNTTPVDYVNSINSSDLIPSNRPTKVEVPKELPKVSMVNTSLKKLKHHLAGFDVVSTSAFLRDPPAIQANTKERKNQEETPSSTQKNKVEAHLRKVGSSLKNKDCVVKPKGTAHMQHSKLNANSELKCVKCNGCMLSNNNHDLCGLDFIN